MPSGDLSSADVEAPGPRHVKTTQLGDVLLRSHFITREQLDEALRYQRAKGGRLGHCLMKLGYLTEDVLHSVLSRQFGLEFVVPAGCEIDAAVLKLLPRELALRFQVIPIRREGNVLYVAMSDPNDVSLFDELTFRTGLRIKPLLASEAQIREGIDYHFGSHKDHALKKVFDDMPKPEGEEEEDDLQILDAQDDSLDPQSLQAQ